uniref:Pentatricopeptide repeat-containing protein n=1 Tax=Ananas comosus var. bracteatus TaxID=296719 RepID=A0A6V7P6S3_ANACO|nr:unnamed protein product [Ananas comosus var. bracteatus]
MSLPHPHSTVPPPCCGASKDLLRSISTSLTPNPTRHRTPPPPPPTSPSRYNALIRAHVESHRPDSALLLFNSMLRTCSPDKFTFPLALKACAHLSAVDEGEQIHSMIVKSEFVPTDDVHVSTSLMSMYALCGRIDAAQQLFDKMPNRNVVSWNTLLDGFVKSGDIDSAYEVFDAMPERNVVSWNSMIAGFVKNDLPREALMLFIEMMVSGLVPDEYTMASVISAISDLGLLDLGRRAHGYVTRRGFLLCRALGVELLNMYIKCGDIGIAYQVFLSISEKNVNHWTAMIGGFAAHGHAEASIRLFSEMRRFGVEPNYVTFIGVLNACSHGGLVKEGLEYFNLMRNLGIKPRIQHYGCLVDLLGRAGLLELAMKLVGSLSTDPGFIVWSALLAACEKHENVEIAEIIAHKLSAAEAENGGCYTLLSNLYARMGKWEDFSRMRRMIEESGVEKVPGFSWIEVDGVVHEFAAGDKFHRRNRDIYRILEEMKLNLRSAGYENVAGDSIRDGETIDEAGETLEEDLILDS